MKSISVIIDGVEYIPKDAIAPTLQYQSENKPQDNTIQQKVAGKDDDFVERLMQMPDLNKSQKEQDWEIREYGYIQNNEGKPDQQYIYKVIRKSDKEIFAIDDKIGWGTYEDFKTTILSFRINNGRLEIGYDTESPVTAFVDFQDAYRLHKKLLVQEQPKPLFTTEDGVDIKKVIGFVWLVNYVYTMSERSVFDTISLLKEYEGKEITFKLFSTKEAAEQYVLENNPCLSLKEVLKEFNDGQHSFEFRIKKLANSKINKQ